MLSFRTLSFPMLALLMLSACTGDPVSYNRDIRPIFNAQCLACHGGVKKSGGFSLLFPEDALEGKTESGKAAIVPGKHGKSELYRRLVHHDPEHRMPLDGEPLTEDQIELIARWIDQGAKWEQHWAYIPPQPVAVPKVDSAWAREDMDYFIQQKLLENGLHPEAEADRSTLLRRVSLDLTGLPPAPELVDAFLADNSPDAYSKVVDQLLASPHFGERWAAMWLDLARYADSKGYEKDPHRNIWKYREWVIRAFNEDMPFDRFSIEQIAGDLLPDAAEDQFIATAFHRNTMTNTEGGTEDEEFRLAAIQDRVTTTFDVWQSTTMACVQCHSHPYDPFRHQEYYELMAVFNNTRDNDLNDERPNLEIYPPAEAQEIEEIVQFIKTSYPASRIADEALLPEQARQAMFPRFRAVDCDEYDHVVFDGGLVSNWSMNANEGIKKRYFFAFKDIPLQGLKEIIFTYSTQGNGAAIELRLDNRSGPVIARDTFPQTENGKGRKMKDLKAAVDLTGISLAPDASHDLVFEIINTVKKIPEGAVWIQGVELLYEDGPSLPAAVKKRQDRLVELRGKANRTPVMQERGPAFGRTLRVFERGNFLTPGDTVAAAVPDVFPQLAEDVPPRLAFAQWLVSTDNPLTARVIVNRFWEQIFGAGLLSTLEDFGTQSDLPSHPELLDYLALRFMHEQQWSVKSLLREWVHSATYRQSSVLTPQKREKDPFNTLLSRGPRFRLSAEQIRDQALAVSGLLNDTLGGPRVMPRQPEGIWQVVYSDMYWEAKKESDRYRRGLYTYWRRTTPYPSMIAFDSPSREFCVSRRIRTNTPLQALVTLNDPVYLEAAAALAARMRATGGDDLAACIQAGYRRALAREADAETVEILLDLYQQAERELAREKENPSILPVVNRPKPPQKAASDKDKPEAAPEPEPEFEIQDPMTVVANAIMNLDAFVTKE